MRIRTPDQRVRVFISSTLAELADERRAARAAVEQLRLTPVMFELGARPHPPRALYRSYLAQSDVFVAIYWQRYGWVAPDMEISGLEDELVLSAGMPRLVYVKRPAPDLEPRLAEMLHRLEGDDGPSYKPFTDAAELGELLADDLALLLGERFTDGDDVRLPAGWSSNLPAPTSSFIGRAAELEVLRALLADDAVRLLTLSGPGGTGKTRLALEVARREQARFDDGAVFVDLADVREPDEVFATIARTLELADPAPASPVERVGGALEGRHILLLLDNLEQAVAVGPALVGLLEACPRVKLLVTSREALRVSAEHVVDVPVLSLPPEGPGAGALGEVLRSEAGRLFVERAAAVGSGFVPTDEDAVDIVAICRRLDGLPLAIELAAARMRLFSVGELRAELDERLDVLVGGGRDRPDRQRTLRHAIAWSEQLLTDDERAVFRLFSVFADARLPDVDETLRALPATSGIDVVETLGSLVDKSLVKVAPGSDRRLRFSMLQTIREHAAAQLDTEPERRDAARDAHAATYTSVAVALHRRLTFADRAEVLASLGDELGNLRAAWAHLVARRDLTRLHDLLEPLWGYHEARGDYQAAVELGEDLLGLVAEQPDTDERRHDELTLRANLARTRLVVEGFSPEAERAIVEALALSEGAGPARQRFPALKTLASLQLWRADFEHAAATAGELMALAEHDADPALLSEAHLTRCISSTWVRDLPEAIDDADRAAVCFDDATSGFVSFRVGTNPGVVAHAIAGLLRWSAGYPDAAATSMQRALDLADALDHPYSLAFALHHATLLDLWRSDMAAVAARAEVSSQVADAHDYAIWWALATILRGAAMVAEGDPAAGLAELERGFDHYLALVTPPIFWPSLLTIRAAVHGDAGDVEGGLVVIEEAYASLGPDHPAAAEVALAHGDLLLATPDGGPAAEATFERVVRLAAARGARMVQLQALTRLAARRLDGSEGDDAHRALRALYDTFDEGHGEQPLQAAAAVLARRA